MKKWFLTLKIIFQFILNPSLSYFSIVDRVYRAELEKNPNDPYLLWFLANQYVQNEKYPEAEFFLEVLINLGKKKREIVLLLSKVYFKLEKSKELVKLLKDYEGLRDEDLHNYYLGMSFLNLERFSEAIIYLKKYVQNHSNEYIPFVRLGYAYFMEKKYDHALNAYQKAKNISHDNDNTDIFESIKLCTEKLDQVRKV